MQKDLLNFESLGSRPLNLQVQKLDSWTFNLKEIDHSLPFLFFTNNVIFIVPSNLLYVKSSGKKLGHKESLT